MFYQFWVFYFRYLKYLHFIGYSLAYFTYAHMNVQFLFLGLTSLQSLHTFDFGLLWPKLFFMVIMNPKTILGSTHIAEQFFFYDSCDFDFQLLQPNLNLNFNPTKKLGITKIFYLQADLNRNLSFSVVLFLVIVTSK